MELEEIKFEADFPKNMKDRDDKYNEKTAYLMSLFNDELKRIGGFRYLNRYAAPTKYSYVSDLKDFFNYLCKEKLVDAENIKDISIPIIQKIIAEDVNNYLSALQNGEIFHKQKRISKTPEKIKGRKVKFKRVLQEVEISKQNQITSVARRRASIAAFFTHLYKKDCIEINIKEKMDTFKLKGVDTDNIKRLQEDEVMRMLDIVRTGEGLSDKQKASWENTKHRDSLMLLLFLTYGLRLFEIKELNLTSFNFDEGYFIIYRKAGKVRNIPLSDKIIEALETYIKAERPKYAKENEVALLLSQLGNRLSERQIREIVKKYTGKVLKYESKGYSPHKLRSTVASSLIERGEDIYSVQDYLDHSHVSTTERYAQHRKESKKAILKNFKWE